MSKLYYAVHFNRSSGKWDYVLDTGTLSRKQGLETEEVAYQSLAEELVHKRPNMEFVLQDPIRYLKK